MSTFKKTGILLLPILLLIACTQRPKEEALWDMKELAQVPEYRILAQDSVISLIYGAQEYRGKEKEVFAYYCTPGLLAGERENDHNLPAMVLVHGGGGTAFRDWVVLWARKGYAALAMDTRGFGEGRQPLDNGFREPESGTPYYACGDTLSEHWLYQAVGDVIKGHSLLRNFPEVDSSRTALTGISWGGVITGIVSGVDTRFKAFVPVYGCGYLYENSNMKVGLEELPAEAYDRWVASYDPSRYVGKFDRPFLFVNGTNDGHFYLDSYKKTYSQASDRVLSVKPRMRHGHSAGWNNAEIYTFIDHLFKGTPGLPVWGEVSREGDMRRASIAAEIPIVRAELNYTTDGGELKSREWKSVPAEYREGQVVGESLPEGATVWYFSVVDAAGNFTSGDIVFER